VNYTQNWADHQEDALPHITCRADVELLMLQGITQAKNMIPIWYPYDT